MIAARTFAGLTATEWVAVATVALVGVTLLYVWFTHRLVRATTSQHPVEFGVTMTAYNLEGHPVGVGDDGTVGPFPDLILITGLGARVFVHSVHFNGRVQVPEEVPGGMEGEVPFLDPQVPPVSLSRGESLYCGFRDTGSWALASPDQEVTISVEYSLGRKGKLEPPYRKRVRPVISRSG